MMKKLYILFMICSIVVLTTMQEVHSTRPNPGPSPSPGPSPILEGQDELREWYRRIPQMKQKVTELHFYLHDIVSGPNPTNVPVLMSNFTQQSSTFFGMIAAMDDLLTVGPSPDSEILGRAQGLFMSTSLETTNYKMTFNIVFTSGEYNGSTITVVGANPFLNDYRELPVVGGSGVFRLASGSAMLENVSYNTTSGDAVVEYHVMVLHYE